MSIIHVEIRENPFVQVDKNILNDKRLSFKAKGVLVYLLSKPKSWNVYVGDLVKQSPDGEYAIRSALKELVDAGYANVKLLRGKDGRMEGSEWTIRETPSTPYRGFPDAGFPDPENRAVNNNDCSNNDLNNIKNAREKEKPELTPELPPQPTDPDNLIEGMKPEAWFNEKEEHRLIPQNSGSFTGLSTDEYRTRIQQALVDNAQSSNGKNAEIENYLTRVPENVRPLAREFCYAFGRKPANKGEDKYWRESWNTQAKIGIKPEYIGMAIQKMQEDGLTYKSPASVTAIAERLMRESTVVVDPYRRYNAVYNSAGERIK